MSLIPSLDTVRNVALLAVGFGFVVFWHELGHFLAAKWAGVKVEQFAVGFGQALFSWRKGIGFRVGNTQKDYQKRLQDHLDLADGTRQREEVQVKENEDGHALTDRQVAEASAALGLGETEYRLNWIPLGGYVKMLGQDDLKPNAEADDPRAFNRQPIGKRMVIVSAGVIMNVILAAVGFMALFLIGFHVQPALIGSVSPGSPAYKAGLLPGDRILTIDGKDQHNDWTKVQLNAALCSADENTVIEVERVVDGQKKKLRFEVKPERGGMSKEFLGFGISPPNDMKAPTLKEYKEAGETIEDSATQAKMYSEDLRAIQPGEAITAVAGKPLPTAPEDVKDRAFLTLYDALQHSDGKPVQVMVAGDGGKGVAKPVDVRPHFEVPFHGEQVTFGGMVTRVRVDQVLKDSPCFGKVLPGDVIAGISTNAGGGSSFVANPGIKVFRQVLNDAAKAKATVNLTVLRDDKSVAINGLGTAAIDPDNSGLKIAPGPDEEHTVVADVQADSAAQKAQVPAGATLLQVAGHPVATWFDVQTRLRQWLDQHRAAAGAPLAPVPLVYRTEGGVEKKADLEMNKEEADGILANGYRQELELAYAKTIRKTSSPLVAARWGVVETRDFILQFYLTLRRMATGGVSPKNMMGPLGIFQAGSNFAAKGNDWLIWFLSMISANLAVVNFLPIPIVDGGLFTFLILEKVKGKPLSPKTQAIAQYVGMALLLGVFLFVTWQDLSNFRFRMH